MNNILLNKTLIIAEAGVNHNGDIEIAKRLIDVAASSGADYVKFQTFKTEHDISKFAEKAEYQKNNLDDGDDSQYSMVKKLELSHDDHHVLLSYCNDRGIKFFSTAFDLYSIKFLDSLKMGLWKIPSGEITNYPYLKEIALKHEPIILSTGMCNMEDIENALSVLLEFGMKKDNICILHCNTEYPTPMEDVNLKAMLHIAEKFNVRVGYSDHTLGIEVPIAAAALGATVIEKHFTLDKNMEGPDHKASLEPDELKAMVKAIRNVEKVLSGTGIKEVSTSEFKNKLIARKSIVANTSIKKGDVFSENNITAKRPGTGISPMQWNNVIGKISTKDYSEDQLIEL